MIITIHLLRNNIRIRTLFVSLSSNYFSLFIW